MPVPEDCIVTDIYPLTIHSVGGGGNGKNATTINIKKDATVADILDTVLQEFAIDGSSNNYDLCEVFNDYGEFATEKEVLLDNARTLSYSEQPVSVTESWLRGGDSLDLPEQKTDFEKLKNEINGGSSEIQSSTREKYRLYLSQKIESILSESDVKVTWFEGLGPNIAPEEWKFDPFYRDSGEIDDLVNLPVLTEEVLLDELCKRFRRGRIYTYVGGILIAVNPFKYFPIYNPKYINAYQHRKLGELPPHVFAIADAAYLQMLQDKKNQCIVISGESGSGKTESTKLILHHLTALSHKTKATVLEKTILAAGPVLEAFGNAKTSHNNNSSRFGKFTQINYRADGVVCGAVLKKYLLEKSRIVSQAKHERNYHVFYQLLAGATQTEKEEFNLATPDDYYYLNQSECYTIDGVDEAYEFGKLRHAIKNIGLHASIQHRMFAVLSAVLHIGNIKFKKKGFDDLVTVDEASGIELIAKLLQVEKKELTVPLTSRKTITRGEEFVINYKRDEAIATRDAMAKCLYVSLFDWLVLQTNHIMVNRHGRRPDKKAYSIGVLDIFGFENFEMNSFEQFCINLANENLQYYLNQHIFNIRQDEYVREGLEWESVDYVDNSTCLSLMVGKPTGMIWLLDEECSLPMGTDKSLLEKFNQHHQSNSCYEMPPTREPVFSIVHYAGHVKYQIKDFRTKNRDLMRNDIVMMFKNSRMLFMRELMGSDPIAIYYWSILRHLIKAIALFKKAGEARAKGEVMFERKKPNSWASTMTPPNRFVNTPLIQFYSLIRYLAQKASNKSISKRKMFIKKMTELEPEPGTEIIMKKAQKVMTKRVANISRMIQSPSKVRSGLEVKRTISGGMTEVTRRGGLKQPPTVVAQFQSSLLELMETLNKSHPFFVRCVRSNAQKEPLEFDAELVLRQLRYTGMLETVKIRQAGYPSRILIKDFMSQFKLLFPRKPTDSPSRDELTEFLKKIGLDESQFQVGETKVFMRESQYRLLRQELQKKIDLSAGKIQRWTRGILKRHQYLRMRKAAVTIQIQYRKYKIREYKRREELKYLAALRIQDFWRVLKEPRFRDTSYFTLKFKYSIILIQSRWRGYVARKNYRKRLQEKKEKDEDKQIASVTPPKGPVEGKDVGQPYSSHKRKRSTDQAAHVLHGVLKDTIFNEEEARAPSPSGSTDGLNVEKNLAINKKPHVYEEIDDFDKVFNKNMLDIPSENTSTPLVKLRSDSGVSSGSDVDRNSQNFAKKIKRRLSLTSRDKKTVNTQAHHRKAKEAEDFSGFVLIDKTTITPKNSYPIIQQNTEKEQQSHQQHNQQQKEKEKEQAKSTIAEFFNSLNRKGSKKITKGEKRPSVATQKPVLYENEFLIDGETELEVFNHFLTQKVKDMNRGYPDLCKNDSHSHASLKHDPNTHKKDGEAELLFKNALHKYHGTLLFTCGTQVQQKEPIQLKYIDLVNGFQEVLNQMINQDVKLCKEFSIMGINLFRGIIEEYQKNREKLIVKWKNKKRRKHKAPKKNTKKDYIDYNGHCFYKQTCYITTYCEFCNAIIHDGFGLKCQACHYTCHKKCYSKNNKHCKGRRPSVCGPAGLFGTDLSEITSPNNPIPLAIIKLMQEIEKRGLYAVGLYRKPGLQAAVNNLKSVLTSTEAEDLIFEDERPHTLASLLKLFFRQLPKPVVCTEFYEDFLRCTDLEKEDDMHTTMYELIQKFPTANRELFERMIVHLARVANNEDCNKMSPNGLAIIWAPCFLRAPLDNDPLASLQALPKLTKCIEVLIETQLRTRRKMLKDISVLEEATSTAEEKLDSLLNQRSLERTEEVTTDNTDSSSTISMTPDMDFIASEISNMDEERRRLTSGLSTIAPVKTRSIDSLDDLGSETDNEMLQGSFEDIVIRVSPSQQSILSTASDLQPSEPVKKTSTFLRKKFAEGNESSFEDIASELEKGSGTSL